jgi:hypothetical protein
VGLVTIDLLFPQAKDILDIGVLVAAPEAHLRTRKAQKATKGGQKATKGGKGQKSTKSPKAAPSPNPSAAPSAAPSITPPFIVIIQSSTSLNYLDGVSSNEDFLFLNKEFKGVVGAEWLLDRLETGGEELGLGFDGGEFTIQNLNNDKYMDGRDPSKLDQVGKVKVSSWDRNGSIVPEELVWEIEKIWEPSYYSIRSKSSGGYLDGRSINNGPTVSLGAQIIMTADPAQPVGYGISGNFGWYIEPPRLYR